VRPDKFIEPSSEVFVVKLDSLARLSDIISALLRILIEYVYELIFLIEFINRDFNSVELELSLLKSVNILELTALTG